MVLCKLKVEDPLTKGLHTITGEVRIEQVLCRQNNWITLINTQKARGNWEKTETMVFKGDIKDITFYEAHSFYSFDRNTLMLNNSLFAPQFEC